MNRIDVSFVIPVFNEEDNVNQLCSDITDVAKEEGYKYEIILINDGSSDKTWKRILEASKTFPKVTGMDLAINSGQSAALAAGIELARGEFIVTLDGDLQNDPKDVPMMLSKQKEHDWDMVAGERVNRKDKLITRKLPSRIANSMIRILSGVKLRDYGCALRVFKQETAKNLELYGELHRFIPVLAVLQGATMVQVPVRHHKRSHGKSKYGLGRIFRVISDLMFMVFFKRYKDRPIHLFGTLGIITFGLGAIIDIYLLVLKILGHDIWGKPLLLLGFLLTIGGIQIITIGIISEILMRTYYESQNKKPYRIKRTIRSEEQD
jgi:glycosyltransferase involved in cell wall biosynthesis